MPFLPWLLAFQEQPQQSALRARADSLLPLRRYNGLLIFGQVIGMQAQARGFCGIILKNLHSVLGGFDSLRSFTDMRNTDVKAALQLQFGNAADVSTELLSTDLFGCLISTGGKCADPRLKGTCNGLSAVDDIAIESLIEVLKEIPLVLLRRAEDAMLAQRVHGLLAEIVGMKRVRRGTAHRAQDVIDDNADRLRHERRAAIGIAATNGLLEREFAVDVICGRSARGRILAACCRRACRLRKREVSVGVELRVGHSQFPVGTTPLCFAALR